MKKLLEKLFGGITLTWPRLIIFASILGVLRYREQWLAWIVADSMMFMMWVNTGNIAILTMRGFYILASVYGYVNWRKLVRKAR